MSRLLLLFVMFLGVSAFAGDLELPKIFRPAIPEALVACGGEGARCTTNMDCCGGSCRSGTCYSGLGSCKGNGASCTSSNQCCSNYCMLSKCQGHP